MKRINLKKCISVITALLVLSTNVSFAQESAIDSKYPYALSQCISLGIFKGDSDGIRPDSVITRAEAVTTVLRILSLENTAKSNAGQTPFRDVKKDHWAAGQINTAFIRGIIGGKANDIFDPSGNVTRFQLIKMLVCALGYETEALSGGEGYPKDYLNFAKKLGLIDEIPAFDEDITRRDAAQLLYDALYIPFVDELTGQKEELAERFGVAGKQEDQKTRIGTTYYLSPDGDDEASGSEETPWKTLSVATKRLAAGDTLILEDGTYYESNIVLFRNGGREDAPITVTSRNMHGAKIIFRENLRAQRKMETGRGQDYIIIQNLEMTQEAISNGDTNDIFIAIYGNYNSVLYNKIYYGYEEGIKSHATKGLRVIGNEVDDMVHEAFDAVNIEDAVIANNRFTDWGRVGIMVKGGSRNIKINNNYVEVTDHKKDTYMPAQGIGIGGSTDNHSGLGTSYGIHEGYNYAVWNNIVYSPVPGILGSGLCFSGSKDCIAFNNVVYGAGNGMLMYYPSGIRNGWEWDPEVVNPVLYNNIFAECTENGYKMEYKPHNLISDYNLFYKTRTAPVEKHSIYEDPKFMEPGKDFRLREDSPARDAGRTMEISIPGYYGEPMYLDLRDYAGNERKDKWSMGAYVFGAMSAKQAVGGNVYGMLMVDGFDYSNTGDWNNLSGEWEISDGILRMTNKNKGRSMLQYTGGLTWSNYTVEADVQVTDSSDKERCSGILFRGDLEFKNVYAFRFKRNNALELCKWEEGSFASIKIWDYTTIPDEVYRMKVSANGNKLTFYINDELIDTVEDTSFLRGTVGLYAYYAPIKIDNILVTAN